MGDIIFWLFVLAIPLAIAIGIMQSMASTATAKREAEEIETTPNFLATEKFVSLGARNSIAIDQARRKVRLSDALQTRLVNFEQIVSAEVVESGISVTKTNRGSQLAGALIGGVALGGVGAVIGGLSGSSTTSDKGTIELRIITDDLSLPYVGIPFIPPGFKKTSPVYKHYLEEALRWHGRLAGIIREGERSRSNTRSNGSTQSVGLPNIGVADELQKLMQLKLEGIISEEEFASQKRRLLQQS